MEFKKELIDTANYITRRGYGILAADESHNTIGKKFSALHIENTEENRRAYRELLFSTEGLENYISGVILFEEQLTQKDKAGKTFVEVLQAKKILPGIKVDKGVVPIMGTDGEEATQGLDDLHKRCAHFYSIGCRFAKWRNVLRIGNGKPSNLSILHTAEALARYASICQANGIVPIVEPEILVDGDHSIEVCQAVTERVLAAVFKALNDHKVLLEGCLLKPNMVTAGSTFPGREKITSAEIAGRTITALRRTVPPALPGVTVIPAYPVLVRWPKRRGSHCQPQRNEQGEQPLGSHLLLRPCPPKHLREDLEGRPGQLGCRSSDAPGKSKSQL